MTLLSTFHHKDSFKWIDYHFQSVVFNLNIFREWGRENWERRGINWTPTWYQVESYSFLHDENLQFSSLSSSSSQSDREGYHFFHFGQLKWIISFQFNHHFLFRAVIHFRLWSHHRHLKSRQMNRLFLSINYLQFISSWGWGRGGEGVTRVWEDE